jgi:hypothetical protein
MKAVEAVMAYYHTEQFLNDQLDLLEAALEKRQKEYPVDKKQADRIATLARRIYKPYNLSAAFKTAFARQVKPATLEALHAWQLSVSGIKLRQGLEGLYAVPPATWQGYFDKEKDRILKPNRKNALETFLRNWGQPELAAQKLLGADYAVALALDAMLPEPEQDGARNVKKRIGLRRTAYIGSAAEPLRVANFYMLRAVKNAEIDEMSKFGASTVAADARRAYLKALALTLESAASTLVSELKKPEK